jgi:uncharacterized membrane protein
MQGGVDNLESSQKIYDLALKGSTAAQWLIDAWSWVFFAINTSLTASIMYKIMCVASFSFVLHLMSIYGGVADNDCT